MRRDVCSGAKRCKRAGHPYGIVTRAYDVYSYAVSLEHRAPMDIARVSGQGRLLVKKVVGPRDWSHPQVMAMFERLLAAPDAGS